MKLALIGCGPDGLAYAAAARAVGIDLAACADTSLAAAQKAAALARTSANKDAARLLKQDGVDAVILASPPVARAAHVRLAIAHGKHVLCSAPIASEPTHAKILIESARAAGVHLCPAYDGRVAPEDLALAAQLDAYAAGKPGFIRVHRAVRIPKTAVARRGKKAVAGDAVIAGLLARELDWLVRRFGLAGTVFAQGTAQAGLDHAALTLTFPRGPIAQLIGTRAANGLPDRVAVEICGTGGMIQFSSDDPVFESTARAGHAQHSNPITPDLHARHLQRFLQCLAKPPAKQQYEHELNLVRVIDAALRSLRTGREQRP